MTPNQAKACLAVLAGFYPGRVPVSATVAKAWAWALKETEAEPALLAIRYLSMTSKWPPSVSEILRHISDKNSGAPSAEEAWAITSAAVTEHPTLNRYNVAFEYGTHHLVAEASFSIPSRDIARGDAAARAHYMRIYNDLKDRQYTDTIEPQLMKGSPDDPRLGGSSHISDIIEDVLGDDDEPPVLGSGPDA